MLALGFGFGFGCCCAPPPTCNSTETFASLPDGYTTHELSGSSEAPVFGVASNRLDLSNGTPDASGTWYKSFPLSSLTTAIEVEAKVYRAADKTGIFIGDVAVWRDVGGALTGFPVDTDGDITGAQRVPAFATATAAGDVLKIRCTRSGSLWNINYYHNGVSVRSETGVSLPGLAGSVFTAGVWGEQGGQWDDLAVRCHTTCSFCVAVPVAWTFTVSGITNRNCLECPAYNGTFELDYNNSVGLPTQCFWRTSQTPLCGVPGNNVGRWALFTSGGTIWTLTANFNGGARAVNYSNTSAFNCLSSNVMSYVNGHQDCQNWPATITIEPG